MGIFLRLNISPCRGGQARKQSMQKVSCLQGSIVAGFVVMDAQMMHSRVWKVLAAVFGAGGMVVVVVVLLRFGRHVVWDIWGTWFLEEWCIEGWVRILLWSLGVDCRDHDLSL